jgi:hypothetical protein
MSRLTRTREGRRVRTGVIGPLILILLGGAFWLRDAGVFDLTAQLGGWLIALVAVLLLASAVPAGLAGRWRGVVGRLLAGLILAGVAAMLLLGVDLSGYFPLLLVAAGVLLLLPAVMARGAEDGNS